MAITGGIRCWPAPRRGYVERGTGAEAATGNAQLAEIQKAIRSIDPGRATLAPFPASDGFSFAETVG